ncbi:AMP-dependent synthetase and ligase [Haloterrigena turkmenica DSM 5511]|uniref:AMP-dependent synthetase and ligase n=1 Tax=Haloterrigena turkmenica (strain ATCC 51198 / DSM 5511 / JCM 9101 / NCIMB 13204 / VKM B-1734 / 4k) TaxID=543526 RepID=D2RSQ5_HALTV|nr:AMP-binding protein [Haloterrigena turkmenica]ADB60831.1 AMP-dependent synthetase and ligase [Haloterrigena turkmenica DSM 5511]
MAYTVTLEGETYDAASESFAWDVPDEFNAAADLVGKHDDGERVALYQVDDDGGHEEYTFDDLDERSNAVATALASRGLEREDRVAVVVPQKPANVLTHLAAWKLGAISLPLSVLFGDDALRYRLTDSEARVAVVDASQWETMREVAPDCPALEYVFVVDDGESVDGDADEAALEDVTVERFDEAIDWDETAFDRADTDVDTPAIVMYTSGSTGEPKGVLHTHGVWLGHCPAFQMYFERDVRDGVYWTPADWAWIGALGDLVFPAWHYGQPVVGYPMGSFDPEQAYELMAEFDVTNAFVPPTAIRMLMNVADPTDRYDLSLEAICSGGEPLTREILEWADEELAGVVVNELYGQTEANLLVTNCREWFPAKPGSMGQPVPGHDVAVLDPETGERVESGEIGEIAVRRGDDPVIFEEYWNAPEKTEAVTLKDGPDGTVWHLTGDLAKRDEDGYCWFTSRDDDLIITSGYRVAPREVEETILAHDAVEQVGVVGVPDETRGEIIKAVVQPVSGETGSDELRSEIRNRVREKLAEYEYPREIEFVDELPTTTTGKIRRTELV